MLVVLVAHACGKMPMLQWWSSQLGPPVGAFWGHHGTAGTVGKSEVDEKWKSSNIGIQLISSKVGVYKMVATCKLTAKSLEA